jgi:hypothetical protein
VFIWNHKTQGRIYKGYTWKVLLFANKIFVLTCTPADWFHTSLGVYLLLSQDAGKMQKGAAEALVDYKRKVAQQRTRAKSGQTKTKKQKPAATGHAKGERLSGKIASVLAQVAEQCSFDAGGRSYMSCPIAGEKYRAAKTQRREGRKKEKEEAQLLLAVQTPTSASIRMQPPTLPGVVIATVVTDASSIAAAVDQSAGSNVAVATVVTDAPSIAAVDQSAGSNVTIATQVTSASSTVATAAQVNGASSAIVIPDDPQLYISTESVCSLPTTSILTTPPKGKAKQPAKRATVSPYNIPQPLPSPNQEDAANLLAYKAWLAFDEEGAEEVAFLSRVASKMQKGDLDRQKIEGLLMGVGFLVKQRERAQPKTKQAAGGN